MNDVPKEENQVTEDNIGRILELYTEKGSTRPKADQRVLQKVLSLVPENALAHYVYGQLLRKHGHYAPSLKYFQKAIRLSPDFLFAHIETAFTLAKLNRLKDAAEKFEFCFSRFKATDIPYSMFMYYVFLIIQQHHFDYEKAHTYIMSRTRTNKDMIETGASELLAGMLEKQITQIYGEQQIVSGIILFVDLVGSTQYKYDYPELWKERTLHFLTFTRFSLKIPGFDFIKFIGDEVMMFLPFSEESDRPHLACTAYNWLFDEQRWYTSELNRFNPASVHSRGTGDPHRIQVKMYLGIVENATRFSPNADSYYDLIGEDVDRAARVKDMAAADMVVVDDKFQQLLRQKGGMYADAFSDMKWKRTFKGIHEPVKFHGKYL